MITNINNYLKGEHTGEKEPSEELCTSSLADKRKRAQTRGGKWFDSIEGIPYPATYVIEHVGVHIPQNILDSGFNS